MLKHFRTEEDPHFEEFTEEIQQNMDNIKCLSLVYLQKIMRTCHSHGYQLNPANIIKYAY